MFHVYGGGHYLGVLAASSTVVDMAWRQMDSDGREPAYCMNNRINRGPIRNIIKSLMEEVRRR